MFSGTVPNYLFFYVFLLFPEVQKCDVFRHCVRLFVYLCISIILQKSRNVMFSGTVPDYLFISIISKSPEMSCFQALCQIICLFMYFYYFQKSRNVMFSGTVSDYLFIYVFLLFPEVQKCYVFGHRAILFVYLCIYFISRSPKMLCFLALCQIICLFMYLYYFQKSRNVMFSGTVSDYLFMYFYYFQKSRNVMFSGIVPDYLFIYVFILFPEVQKCYVFWHCVRLLVYLCISIISRSPEMSCFQALCQIICLFMYFYYFQKSRNVMFSGIVPDYLFIYVFILFPEVQKCYVFWHCVRLLVYLCISIISRSPEMLCFLAPCQIIRFFIHFYYFQKSRNVMFSGTVPYYLFIYVFLLFPEVQKCYVFWHRARLFVFLMYFYYFQKSRNVMFSGTVSDYLFIYVFLLFPGVQKCYVFWHRAKLFVFLCISIISRSPEM